MGRTLRQAVVADDGDRRPWWPLVPLGAASVAMLSVLAARDTSWRDEPILFASLALGMGASMCAALAVVRTRRLPMAAIAWILGVGVLLQIIGMGLWHSDDVNRYAVEGRQILAGQNPYHIPPADPAARALVPAAISDQVNHPEMTAIYPPAWLLASAGVQALLPGLTGFTIAACLASVAAIGLALLLLVRTGGRPGLVVAVAWHPVLAIFASGEAHNDILMAVLVLAALLLATLGRAWSAIVTATVAILVKPFAAIVLPALLAVVGWRRWWLVPAIAVVLYLPFVGAGGGLVASLITFGGSLHYHGALDPWVRLGVTLVMSPAHVEMAVRGVLVVLLAGGLGWLWLRRGDTPLPTLAARLLGVLLLCLPTLHPWYFTVLVVLLPFARSWGLTVWTACAGVYWLHGLRMIEVGSWVETPWVTALAHLPGMLVLLIEVVARRRPTTVQEPVHA